MRGLPGVVSREEASQTSRRARFKHFVSEAVRFAEAPERQIPVSVSPRIEDREVRDEIVRLTEEFISRFEEKEHHRGTDEHAWLRPDA